MVDATQDISFSLANSDSVEIIEFSEERDLGTEAEAEFAQTICGGYLGRVGTNEIGRNIGHEIRENIERPGSLIAKSPTHFLLVPHHFSVRKSVDNYLRTLSSVGIIVDFLPAGQTFSLVDLLPNSRFRAAFEAHLQGDVSVSFSSLLNLFGLGDIGEAIGIGFDRNSESSPFGFSLNFGHSFFASQVAATGIGTTTSIFEFFSGSEPLVDKDFTVWSAVALNKYATELSCRTKLFYTSRIGIIPKRCESEWTVCKIQV
jgi:hypothetical protein